MFEQIGTARLFIMLIAFHGFFLAALLAVGQIMVDRKSLKNVLFFCLFIDFSFMQVHSLLYEAAKFDEYPWLHQLNIPTLCAIGPLLYLLVRVFLEKGFRFKPLYLLHFIPVVVTTMIVFIEVNRFPASEPGPLDGYFYNSITLYTGSGVSLLLLGYIGLIWRLLHVNHVWDRNVLKKEAPARVIVGFVILFTIGRIADALAMVTGNKTILEFSILVFTFTIIFLFLINFRHPGFYQTLPETVAEEKRKRTYLNGLDLERVDSELRDLMINGELYLDSGLSLPLLAEKLHISTHQLSEFLNHRLRMSFNAFVNGYRVEKAKSFLMENKKRTVQKIAYDVGFESKSAFNTAFRHVTGITPTQFRRVKGIQKG